MLLYNDVGSYMTVSSNIFFSFFSIFFFSFALYFPVFSSISLSISLTTSLSPSREWIYTNKAKDWSRTKIQLTFWRLHRNYILMEAIRDSGMDTALMHRSKHVSIKMYAIYSTLIWWCACSFFRCIFLTFSVKEGSEKKSL